MNFYADSNYIHAKIYALHSMLLTRMDYYDMAKSGNFSAASAGVTAWNTKDDCLSIKENLFESQIGHVISLAKSSPLYGRVFTSFLRYFEILNLKLLYAKAFRRFAAPGIWYNTGEFAVLDRGMLSDNTDVAALLKYTQNTWMRGILTAETASVYEEVEFSIERAAFILAAELSSSLSFSRETDSGRIISGLAAYFRLKWSLRLQQIYSWDETCIRSYIDSNIPVPGSGRIIRSSVEEWERLLMGQVRNNYADLLSGGGTEVISPERIMERALLREFTITFHENFNSINTVICYLVLLYRQIRNLFSIADGLRSGLDPDRIMENVICEE
ncbi:MAG TPA: V-type ATPase subunit [Spirochaetota bacterium]|nr:V-type ATPase subunit [Spirochaetota bacterium]